MLSTCVLGVLSIVLVIFHASSAPVDVVNWAKSDPSESLPHPALPQTSELKDYAHIVLKARRLFTNFSCSACKYAVRLLQDMFDSKMTFDAMAEAAAEICYLTGKYSKDVCKGVAHTFKVGASIKCKHVPVKNSYLFEVWGSLRFVFTQFLWRYKPCASSYEYWKLVVGP